MIELSNEKTEFRLDSTCVKLEKTERVEKLKLQNATHIKDIFSEKSVDTNKALKKKLQTIKHQLLKFVCGKISLFEIFPNFLDFVSYQQGKNKENDRLTNLLSSGCPRFGKIVASPLRSWQTFFRFSLECSDSHLKVAQALAEVHSLQRFSQAGVKFVLIYKHHFELFMLYLRLLNNKFS